jgi:hypothetical protein
VFFRDDIPTERPGNRTREPAIYSQPFVCNL